MVNEVRTGKKEETFKNNKFKQGDGYANLQSKVFFVWGSFCLIAIAFVWLMIYETKGKKCAVQKICVK